MWRLKRIDPPCCVIGCLEGAIVQLQDMYGELHGKFCKMHGLRAQDRRNREDAPLRRNETGDYVIGLKED